MTTTTAAGSTPSDLDVEDMGPIDFLCIEFPHRNTGDGTGMQLLVDLVDRGIIRVLDLVFIRKEPGGSVRRMAISELGAQYAVFDGASSGLLDEEDLINAAEAIEEDSAAGLLVYENRWAAPLATALRRQGAQLIASDRLPLQAILAALDAADARA